jgi:hypothetical protein
MIESNFLSNKRFIIIENILIMPAVEKQYKWKKRNFEPKWNTVSNAVSNVILMVKIMLSILHYNCLVWNTWH